MVAFGRRENMKRGSDQLPVEKYDWYAGNGKSMALECHWHDEWEFFMPYAGTAYFYVDGDKRLITEGDVVFVRGGQMHAVQAYEDVCRYRAVVFSPDFLCGVGDIINMRYVSPVKQNKLHTINFMGDEEKPLFEKLFEAISNAERGFEITVKIILLELFSRVLTQTGEATIKPPTRKDMAAIRDVKRVVEYIHNNLKAPITVENLAKMVNMSEGHFTRLFKRLTAKPPIDYVKYARMSGAAKLLSGTDEKIGAVAAEVGLNSVSYFVRSFKDYSGKSPVQYREQSQQHIAQF